MKLAFVELNGFRGYREPLRLDFADRFTIIDGRNGTGKSTVFDAIEFALTGKISKYDGVSAAGETFEDYVWWRGAGPQPASRYVRVGFRDEKGVFEILRGEFKTPDSAVLDQVLGKLCDRSIAPANPLPPR
jgi:chromosome segregation protein